MKVKAQDVTASTYLKKAKGRFENLPFGKDHPAATLRKGTGGSFS